MKKVLSLLACVSIGSLAYGQGTIQFNSSNLGVSTNTAKSHFDNSGTETGGTAGKTAITAGGFYYALLIQSYTGTLSASATNVTGFGWTQAVSAGVPLVGTNGTAGPQAGSILGTGGAGGVAVDGWATPTGATYDTAGHEYIMVVGWSASLGTTWSAVSAQLQSGTWAANGFFGVSRIGDSYAGGANGLGGQSIFTLANAQTLTPITAFTLYSVSSVPEPGTMALAALGGAAMLMFRRRKA